MKTAILALAAATLTGCTLTDLTRPAFPPVPPEKPEARSEEARPEPPKGRPVSAAQVNDRNARDMAQALEAELDRDAAEPAPRPMNDISGR
jgi:hypothetical protein